VRETEDPTRQLLDRLGHKWTVVAITALEAGPMRFGELRRALAGVSQKVLTDVVRSLERDGVFSRHVINLTPLCVQYRLTPLGESLAVLLVSMRDWAATHMHEVRRERDRYDARSRPQYDRDEAMGDTGAGAVADGRGEGADRD
jgi:DNA-binding HxlR family transcriptional regulator